ncbi:hypothetical protein QTP70_027817 [Hemibagrus guttatus]|uniref:Uncharacterized protein n=1 Tax=Hemibagrus guttatus TaxID=175788 RepID=A0AAE0UM69_9TELE|nr:hypothetical protein QTP70_027817 [Hemibagrus guttatus]
MNFMKSMSISFKISREVEKRILLGRAQKTNCNITLDKG